MLQIFVCVGSSCHLKGSYQIIQTFEQLIKLNKLEDKVELKAAFCLGQCTKGVSIKIGEELLGGLTISNAKDIFEKHIVGRL